MRAFCQPSQNTYLHFLWQMKAWHIILGLQWNVSQRSAAPMKAAVPDRRSARKVSDVPLGVQLCLLAQEGPHHQCQSSLTKPKGFGVAVPPALPQSRRPQCNGSRVLPCRSSGLSRSNEACSTTVLSSGLRLGLSLLYPGQENSAYSCVRPPPKRLAETIITPLQRAT